MPLEESLFIFDAYLKCGIISLSVMRSLSIDYSILLQKLHVFVNIFNYQKLKSLWPNMTKSQMIKFSAFKAKVECDIDQYFINDNYKELLNNFKELYLAPKAAYKKIYTMYIYFINFEYKYIIYRLLTVSRRRYN
jgi:glucan phosphoethanolaminetransferase (alkaline phosphatase superfamily)